MAETATPSDPGKGAASADGSRAQAFRTLPVIVALAAGFALLPRFTQSCGTASGNQEAPDFTASVVANAPDPTEHSLTMSKLRGHPVILDFWATWCGPCQAQSPIVNGISQRFKDKGLVVVGVNTSDADGLAAKFAKKKSLLFPMVYDDGNSIARKYGVDNLPTLVVVSKEGKIVAVRHGVTSDSDLERLVRKVL